MRRALWDIAERTPGHLWPAEGPVLAAWAAKAPGPLVEIGSFCGKSTLYIASAAQHPVISIDPHTGNPEMQPGRECFMAEAWDERTQQVDSSPLLRQALTAAGLADNVTVIVSTSLQVARWWTTEIGFLFIDGDHDNPMADYLAWAPFLAADAILAFHDTAIPAVADACAQALRDGWGLVEVVDDCLRVFVR